MKTKVESKEANDFDSREGNFWIGKNKTNGRKEDLAVFD